MVNENRLQKHHGEVYPNVSYHELMERSIPAVGQSKPRTPISMRAPPGNRNVHKISSTIRQANIRSVETELLHTKSEHDRIVRAIDLSLEAMLMPTPSSETSTNRGVSCFWRKLFGFLSKSSANEING